MILVANGCSHTAGGEITQPLERACYEKAWPKHLSDMIGCNHINLADSGASAHRIVRTTLRYIINNFQQKNRTRKMVIWIQQMDLELIRMARWLRSRRRCRVSGV